MTDKTPILEITSLCKKYIDNVVIKNLNLNAYSNQCLGILGPNGAGKSTLVKSIIGLTFPDSGQIKIDGELIQDNYTSIKSRIGIVQQTDNLEEDFSVKTNMLIYGNYYCLTKNLIADRTESLLHTLGLQDKAHEKVRNLSGGMRRRLCIARCLISNPNLIMLDEPTSGLDPDAKYSVWKIITQLKQQGKSIILMTHFMDEAERLCDNLFILHNGSLINIKSPQHAISQLEETNVIEILGQHDKIRENLSKDNANRIIPLGHSTYCYTNTPEALISKLDKSGFHYIHRKPTLEDVYLKITGKSLNV